MNPPLSKMIELRQLRPSDSIDDLTELLHRAYRALAVRGMWFVASTQDAQRTRRRISRGECYVACDADAIVGTVTLYAPSQTRGSPWLDRTEVASFGQFAVEPAMQGRGIGSRLLSVIEDRAVSLGAGALALDTAEPATDLIRFYGRRGYCIVETVQWEEVNYRSVVMSKQLVGAPSDAFAK